MADGTGLSGRHRPATVHSGRLCPIRAQVSRWQRASTLGRRPPLEVNTAAIVGHRDLVGTSPTAVRWILARPPAPRLRTVSALKRKGGQNADSGPLQRLGSRCTRACRSAGSGRLADGHSVRPLVMASPNDLLRADRKYFPRRPRVSLASVTPVADILRQPVCRRRESGSGEPFGLLSTGPAARGSG
jgi:hypothetical protein